MTRILSRMAGRQDTRLDMRTKDDTHFEVQRLQPPSQYWFTPRYFVNCETRLIELGFD
jgi:hypothetical protein